MTVPRCDICVFFSNIEKVFNIGTDLKYCEGKERFINETRSRLMKDVSYTSYSIHEYNAYLAFVIINIDTVIKASEER